MATISIQTKETPPWSIRLNQELDANDRDAREVMSGLSVEDLNRQAEAGAWSIGQCIEHLCLGNEQYLPAMRAALEGKPISPVQEISIGWFGRWFLRSYIEPSENTKRARAPKKIVPASRVDASVLERFLAGNEKLRDLIRLASAHDVNRIRFRNPFIPVIRFTLGTGFQLSCSHERRHLLQARRVKQALSL